MDSGRRIATSTPTSPDATVPFNLNGAVKFSVADTEANGIKVHAYNASDGLDIQPGQSAWFPCQNLKFIQISSMSGSVEYTYFAY